MLTFTTGRNRWGDFCKTTLAADLTVGDSLIIAEVRKILAMREWPFLLKTRTKTTVANINAYDYPYDVEKPFKVTVENSEQLYLPKEAPSRAAWDSINISNANGTAVTSEVPQWWFAFNGQILLYPTPSTSSLTINIHTKVFVKDITIADHTAGNIDIVTNGDETITGAGTPGWIKPMAGRFLRVTESTTESASGDGYWYEIDSITSSTVLELFRAYGGISLTTGASATYIIGQAIPLPEGHQELPIIGAAKKYWAINDDSRRFRLYDEMYREGLQALLQEWGGYTGGIGLQGMTPHDQLNNNLFLRF